MKSFKFSIVTPVYNSFELMKFYFESLEKQTYRNFEVIIVDDCSTNETYDKLLEYKEKSSLNIRIYRNEKNMGPAIARNIGIQKAKGKWITFIDNDDGVEEKFLEKINEILEKEEVDCIVFDYFIKRKNKIVDKKKTIPLQQEGKVSFTKCLEDMSNHTVGKVYKLSNLIDNKIEFPKLRRCEDVVFTFLAVNVCKEIYYLEEALYYYCQREGSLSNNDYMDEEAMLKAFDILAKKFEKKYPIEIAEKSIRDLLYGVVLMMCKAKKKSKDIRYYIVQYEKKYCNWYRYSIIRKLGISKFIFLVFIKLKFIMGLKLLTIVHTKMIKN